MSTQTAIVRRVLGPDGEPASLNTSPQNDLWFDGPQTRKSLMAKYANFVSALYSIRADPLVRSMDPFSSHAWVYACAMAIATNVSQPVLRIYRETAKTQKGREEHARAKGMTVCHHRGEERTARQRYMMQPGRRKAAPIIGVEVDYEHPMNVVLNRPNYLMTGTMLFMATALFQTLCGRCVWVLFGPDDTNHVPGEVPGEIWPMPPELFEPLYSGNRIARWRFQVPQGIGKQSMQRDVLLWPHEVVNFRYINPDPNYLHKGFSPLTPLSNDIYMDQLTVEHNKSMLLNGADPGGVLMSPHAFENEDERKELQADWERRFKGVKNSRKVAVLGGGLTYIQTGMNNKDMMYKDMRILNRDEILAVMGVTKSVLGLTDDLNFATQQSQDKNFWDKKLIPLLRAWEDEIDYSLLLTEPDNIFAAFDLTEVESLRAGMGDAIKNARALSAQELRMPPRLAFETVGLDVPHYDGDMESTPLQQPNAGPNNNDGTTIPDPENTRPRTDRTVTTSSPPEDIVTRIANPWREHNREVQVPAELHMLKAWKGFINEDLEVALDRFDTMTQAKGLTSISIVRSIDFEGILPPLRETQKRLGKKVRPVYREAAEAEIEYIGPQFGDKLDIDVDDDDIAAALDEREQVLLGKAPVTLQKRLRRSLRQGVERGEDISELRERVERVYKRQLSKGRALLIARTESASFINTVRQRIFEIEGILKGKWVTAADEKVRHTHRVYGRSKARPIGFNYMTLTDTQSAGQLTYPGDPSAPVEEVALCRCILIPKKR